MSVSFTDLNRLTVPGQDIKADEVNLSNRIVIACLIFKLLWACVLLNYKSTPINCKCRLAPKNFLLRFVNALTYERESLLPSLGIQSNRTNPSKRGSITNTIFICLEDSHWFYRPIALICLHQVKAFYKYSITSCKFVHHFLLPKSGIQWEL